MATSKGNDHYLNHIINPDIFHRYRRLNKQKTLNSNHLWTLVVTVKTLRWGRIPEMIHLRSQHKKGILAKNRFGDGEVYIRQVNRGVA